MENRELIEKAAMTLADLATGGLMNPTQFQTFYRKIIDAPTILREARTVPMPIDSMKIEKIGFGQRVLRPGIEGQALSEDQLSKPTTSTVTLNAKEVIAEVNITYDTLENNIERDNLRDTIMTMLAERVSLDIEELIINGDTAEAGTDPYLGLLDGVLKKATSHVVDFQEQALDRTAFKQAYAAVPPKYLRNPADWRFYTSHVAALEWKDQIAQRQTALGDAAQATSQMPTAYGVPVQGVAMMQPYQGSEPDVMLNDIILTHPRNILVGISRNIRLEVDKDIRARKFIIVVTMKVDVQFEEEDAVAKVIKVKA